MLTTDERHDIENGLATINSNLTNILKTISIMEKHRNAILYIATSSPNSSHLASIPDILDSKTNLENIHEILNDPLDLTSKSTEQYKTFLLKNIADNDLNYLTVNEDKQGELENILNSTDLNNVYVKNADIEYIDDIIYRIREYTQITSKLATSLSIYKKIKSIEGNIIMIGANGSGKSSFARELKDKFSQNTVIISAQHLLHYENSNTIDISDNKQTELNIWLSDKKSLANVDSNSGHGILSNFLSDMNLLVGSLMSRHFQYTDDNYMQFRTPNNSIDNSSEDSLLMKAIDIWNSLIKHREIKRNHARLYISGKGITDYEFNSLSDGEKAVFYYIANVLLAPPNSYIIIDEPENHLHLTICNKLWDKLEEIRSDCKYIYLTHDYNLATTRTNTTIIWNKKFIPPYTWDFQIIEPDERLPYDLMLELLGTRKDICFCEGTTTSTDYKLYSLLFPEYTIKPVEGHTNVINYVKAYNKLPYKLNKAIGIIDKDCHPKGRIESWKREKIFTLCVNEIENLFVDEYLLKYMINKNELSQESVETYKLSFWEKLESEKLSQATIWVSEYFNNLIKDHSFYTNTNLGDFNSCIANFMEKNNINELYSTVIQRIEKIIKSKNYKQAIALVNFKKFLTKELDKSIRSKKENRSKKGSYVNMVLKFIKEDSDLRNHIRKTHFQPLLEATNKGSIK